LGSITGQGPEFATKIGFLGRQHEKKSEERWGCNYGFVIEKVT